MFPCPKCGKPESSWGDNFCGDCEAQYQADRATEIQELKQQARDCTCAEGCRKCLSALAAVAELEGRPGEAAAIINQ